MKNVYVVVEEVSYMSYENVFVIMEPRIITVCGSIESCCEKITERIENHYKLATADTREHSFNDGFIDSEGHCKHREIMECIKDEGYLRYYSDEDYMTIDLHVEEHELVE